jgi:hypothetical protein
MSARSVLVVLELAAAVGAVFVPLFAGELGGGVVVQEWVVAWAIIQKPGVIAGDHGGGHDGEKVCL